MDMSKEAAFPVDYYDAPTVNNVGDGLLTVGGVLTVFPYRLPD